MEEVWKDIVIVKNGILYDYSGKYQVSNYGNIRSLNYRNTFSTKILKMSPNRRNGYYQIHLPGENGKDNVFSVHRLVANAFLPNPDNLPEVNHKDENPQNNNVENLEWCTSKYNSNYGTRNERGSINRTGKLAGSKNHKAKKVVCIDNGMVFNTLGDAAKWCGLKYGANIGACCSGKTKYAGKHPETGELLHWMYYDEWMNLQK